ncbi:WD40 repeat-like-containing domain protein [Metarhizium album ARSEF 1941]|uniref:WD40 repeat-like-containing domain protein n=1 Tax=Metarhizium album (strain ARSEF 1941) TaxID=1081103 RepID=A0A0B2WKS7_METAS|nr:WD40 repeat-like-containing domain protein [Metarhizium album ARSEF 1941]KHN94553.1 WD40 repeat-like-containing domain protein [Metarhizium album ARSEF 1941]
MYTLANIATQRFSGPEETYVLGVDRTEAGLAAISSDQQLTLLSPARLGGGAVASWQTQHGSLTSLRVLDASRSLACTAGEDGTVSVWDLRLRGAAARVAQFSGTSSPVLSLACCASTHTVAVGTELQGQTASILLWDVRGGGGARAHYREVHSDDVTALAFHPAQPAVLLSGSTDGLVNVYDTRIADEDDLTLRTFNHNASIHRAGFLTGTEVVALSHDEQFALYDLDAGAEDRDAAQSWGDLRTVLGCQYVADAMGKTDGSGVIVGAGAQDKHIFELVFLARNQGLGPKWVFDKENSVGLPGAHGGEIVRSFCFFDDAQVVFTAGEDGNVKAWRGN